MSALLQNIDRLEIDLCVRVNRLCRHSLVRNVFAVVSKLGDGYFWLALATVFVLARTDNVSVFIFKALLTAGVGLLIYRSLKNRLVRERPYIAHAGIACGAAPLDRYSFPSGHTLHAVSFSILFCSYEPAVTILVVPFAVLVAASRIVLGLHYPSDVLAGAAIGALLALVAISF